MNPLFALAIGAVALFAMTGGAAASAAGQLTAFFRDYQWIVNVPNLNNVATQIPLPPGVSPGSGHWVRYPNGIGQGRSTSGNLVSFVAWVNTPTGTTTYAWYPTAGALTQLNGYWVYSPPAVTNSSYKGTKILDQGYAVQAGDIYQNTPAPTVLAARQAGNQSAQDVAAVRVLVLNYSNIPAPPPGESSHSGAWMLKHYGYCVWITPTNGNQADAEQLSAALQAANSTPALPPPASSPLTTT